MNRRILLAAGLALTLLGPAASGHSPATARFDPARLSRHVELLGSDAFEGRGPASAGEARTIAYLIAQFRAAGLAPAGDLVGGRRGWTQAVPLLKSELAAPPLLELHMAGRTQRLTQGEEIALRSPMNGQNAVQLNQVPLLFVGYGVTAPERGWDDFKGQDVRGKMLVVLVNDPDFESGAGEMGGDFGGKAMTYYGRWTYKYEEAARRGAAGVMVIHETVPASYGWATVKNSNASAMFDIVREQPEREHSAFESWI